MVKKLLILAFALVAILSFCVIAFAADGEITISFVKSRDPFDTTTTLDKVAHADGNTVVEAGTEITIPEVADDNYSGTEGYRLIWYTENGRVYEPGEKVAFNQDTRLYRCLAKEVYSLDELGPALWGDTKAGILMADIDATARVGTKGEDQSVLVMNGHTLNISAKDNAIGTQRGGKHLIGEGTVNVTNPNNKDGQYGVFEAKSHGYNGNRNKQTVGVDVTVNAPAHHLLNDSDGSYVTGYPWVRIYGKVNVYTIGRVHNSNRAPRVEIYEGAEVTINAPYLFDDFSGSKLNAQQLQLTIYGGTFNLPENAKYSGFWTNDYYDENVHPYSAINELTVANADKLFIYGGTFNTKLPDVALGTAGVAVEYDEATNTSRVVSRACTGSAHSYTLAEAYEGNERDCTTTGIYYYRCECGAYYVSVAESLGHSYTIIEIEKEASTTENGTKRVTCDRCGDNYTFNYSLSPLEVEVTVTVRTENGTKDITLLAGDLFEMTTEETINGFFCTVSAVKDIDGFTKNDIVKLELPAGVLSVKAGVLKDMEALTEVVLADRSDATFATGAFNNCQALERLTIGNCTVTFESKVVNNCPNFAILDLRQGNAVFKASAFELNAAVKQILMAEGKTYDFGEKAFRECGITTLELVDNSVVRLGKNAFAECQSLEYIYVGRNCVEGKSLPNGYAIFDGISNLKTAVIMDLTYFGQWAFSCKEPGKQYGPLCDLTIYCHSADLSINVDAFNNRKGSYHVYLYVVDPDVTKATYSNCNMTLYNGIGHGYTQDVIEESTCVTQGIAGYKTDCPCGIDYRTNEYTTYSSFDSAMNKVTHEPFGTETVLLPLSTEHKVSDIVIDISFENGMSEAGKKVYKCLHCDVAAKTEDEASFPSIFVDYGYSVSTFDTASVSLAYSINRDAYAQYVEITGNEISYGVATAIKANVQDGKLIDASGKPVSEKVLSFSCVRAMYDVYDVRITGLDNHKNIELYICGYYVVNGEVGYIDGGNAVNALTAVTFEQIAAEATK